VLVARQAEAVEGSFAPGDTGYVGWQAQTALILAQD
jgi:hypothetical protein